MKNELDGIDISIPKNINIVIALLSACISISCLYIASHAQSWIVILIAAIAFSFINNTLFSLMHDAAHFVLHPNRKLNHALGVFISGFFPTGFTFQRISHLNHHRNNRTDVEMFEAYYPNDNKVLKSIQWYGLLLGGYWPMYMVALVLYTLFPALLFNSILRNTDNKAIKHTGADAYIKLFENNPKTPLIKAEIIYSFSFQAALCYLLDYSLWPVAFCYWIFSLNWGALQYADHAYTKRDIRYGAWNLKVNPLVRYLFLNYHYHLVHHVYPYVPWIHLGKFVDRVGDNGERPTFMSIYLKMWKGPRLTTEKSPNELDLEFKELLENGLVAETKGKNTEATSC